MQYKLTKLRKKAGKMPDDRRHMTHDFIFFNIKIVILVLVSVHVQRFSVSCMRHFLMVNFINKSAKFHLVLYFVSVLVSANVKRFSVSRVRDYFQE